MGWIAPFALRTVTGLNIKPLNLYISGTMIVTTREAALEQDEGLPNLMATFTTWNRRHRPTFKFVALEQNKQSGSKCLKCPRTRWLRKINRPTASQCNRVEQKVWAPVAGEQKDSSEKIQDPRTYPWTRQLGQMDMAPMAGCRVRP